MMNLTDSPRDITNALVRQLFSYTSSSDNLHTHAHKYIYYHPAFLTTKEATELQPIHFSTDDLDYNKDPSMSELVRSPRSL